MPHALALNYMQTHRHSHTQNLVGLKTRAAGAEMQEEDALPCGILTLAILEVKGWARQGGNWANFIFRSLSPQLNIIPKLHIESWKCG